MFASQATALVNVSAVSMPIACSLKTCDICGIVHCNKTAHSTVWPFIEAGAIIIASN